MPLGGSKEGKINAEVRKHELEIMENARKADLRKKFHYVDEIVRTHATPITVGGKAYELVREEYSGELRYKKGSGLELKNVKELHELMQLYNEEKLKK